MNKVCSLCANDIGIFYGVTSKDGRAICRKCAVMAAEGDKALNPDMMDTYTFARVAAGYYAYMRSTEENPVSDTQTPPRNVDASPPEPQPSYAQAPEPASQTSYAQTPAPEPQPTDENAAASAQPSSEGTSASDGKTENPDILDKIIDKIVSLIAGNKTALAGIKLVSVIRNGISALVCVLVIINWIRAGSLGYGICDIISDFTNGLPYALMLRDEEILHDVTLSQPKENLSNSSYDYSRDGNDRFLILSGSAGAYEFQFLFQISNVKDVLYWELLEIYMDGSPVGTWLNIASYLF